MSLTDMRGIQRRSDVISNFSTLVVNKSDDRGETLRRNKTESARND